MSLSDGATQSLKSGAFAGDLARGWVRQRGPLLSDATVRRAAAAWKRSAAEGGTGWIHRRRIDRGPAATLLGLEVLDSGAFNVSAVGDTCLFLVRGGKVQNFFPQFTSSGFTDSPDLVQPARPPRLVRAHGAWESGDTLVAATDALSAWILDGLERGSERVGTVEWLARHEERDGARRWASQWRRDGWLLDDVTAMCVTVYRRSDRPGITRGPS